MTSSYPNYIPVEELYAEQKSKLVDKQAILNELVALAAPPRIQPGDVTCVEFAAAAGICRNAALNRMVKLAEKSDEWESQRVLDEDGHLVRVIRKVV